MNTRLDTRTRTHYDRLIKTYYGCQEFVIKIGNGSKEELSVAGSIHGLVFNKEDEGVINP